MVAEGHMPQPKRLYGRTIWDRAAVDAAFDLLDGGNARNVAGEEIYEWSNEPIVHKAITSEVGTPFYEMGSEERLRWLEEYNEAQARSIAQEPMLRRECIALKSLSLLSDSPVEVGKIANGCGYAILERLVCRGSVSQIGRKRHRGTTFQITSSGLAALAAMGT
jgi:hypothetical protein